MLIFYDFIQVYVFTTNHHLKQRKGSLQPLLYSQLQERIKSLIFKTGRVQVYIRPIVLGEGVHLGLQSWGPHRPDSASW